MNSLILAMSVGINRPSDIDGDMLRTILMIAIPVLALQFILLISAVISIAKKQAPTNDKALWICIAVLVNIIGPIVYFAVGSNILDQKAAALEEKYEEQEHNV